MNPDHEFKSSSSSYYCQMKLRLASLAKAVFRASSRPPFSDYLEPFQTIIDWIFSECLVHVNASEVSFLNPRELFTWGKVPWYILSVVSVAILCYILKWRRLQNFREPLKRLEELQQEEEQNQQYRRVLRKHRALREQVRVQEERQITILRSSTRTVDEFTALFRERIRCLRKIHTVPINISTRRKVAVKKRYPEQNKNTSTFKALYVNLLNVMDEMESSLRHMEKLRRRIVEKLNNSNPSAEEISLSLEIIGNQISMSRELEKKLSEATNDIECYRAS